eukprot:COSAG03_NODE_10659_length_636_cov_3658.761639_2_plen_42_part_01
MTYALYRAGKEQLQAHKDALFQKKQAGNEAASRAWLCDSNTV